MTTVGHIALGVLAGRLFSTTLDGYRWHLYTARRSGVTFWIFFFCIFSLLPNIDRLSLWQQLVPPAFQHQGATHSLLVALGVTLLTAGLAALFRLSFWRMSLYLFLLLLSHSLLDALSSPQQGAALLSQPQQGVTLLWP